MSQSPRIVNDLLTYMELLSEQEGVTEDDILKASAWITAMMMETEELRTVIGEHFYLTMTTR